MKKYFSLLVAVFLCIGLMAPLSAFAASKTYYYPIKGTSKTAPGIYKSTVNGKSKVVLKEKVYKIKEVSKPSFFKKEDYVTFYGKG